MISINVSWKDKDKVLKTVDNYPEVINENINTTFKKVMFEIEKYSKMNAPVVTGRLRGDISTQIKTNKITNKTTQGIVFNTVKYAVYVHEGTRYQRANPYMKRAIYNRGEILMERELKRNLLKKKRGLI